MPNIGLLTGRCNVAGNFLVARGVVQQATATRKVQDPTSWMPHTCRLIGDPLLLRSVALPVAISVPGGERASSRSQHATAPYLRAKVPNTGCCEKVRPHGLASGLVMDDSPPITQLLPTYYPIITHPLFTVIHACG